MTTKKRSKTLRKTTKVGERIVRAWFDTVINPMLQALSWEETRLTARNWTWRFELNQLESIRPCRQMIVPVAIDNLEQFASFYPPVAENIKFHDDQRTKLLVACQLLQKRLEESADLRAMYHRVTAPDVLEEIHKSLDDLFGSPGGEHHIAVLAEHIVNNTGVLPSYFTVSPLWNRFREDFVAIAEAPSVIDQYNLTTKAGAKLLQIVNRLSDLLKEVREELSIQHDMPYVTSTSIEQ